jgi:hypothetical protein
MELISWSLTAAALVHISEEFVWPGGFKAWYVSYRPEIAASITDRFLIVINALLIGATVNIGLAGGTSQGIAAWLTAASVMFSNAIFHLVAALRTRRYSPGMLSGLFIYIPLAIYGFAHFVGQGRASTSTALVAFAVGGSYQFFSVGGHRLRSRASSQTATA